MIGDSTTTWLIIADSADQRVMSHVNAFSVLQVINRILGLARQSKAAGYRKTNQLRHLQSRFLIKF
jgi:hypothetical protein